MALPLSRIFVTILHKLVTWPVDAITVHVDSSHSTIWAVVKWNPVVNADHYNLYM